MLKLGNTSINKSYFGNTEIGKLYFGNTLIYDTTPTMKISQNDSSVAL